MHIGYDHSSVGSGSQGHQASQGQGLGLGFELQLAMMVKRGQSDPDAQFRVICFLVGNLHQRAAMNNALSVFS